MFGTDFLTYSYDKAHGTVVDEKVISSLLEYCHDSWEKHYPQDSADPQDDSKHLCHPRVNLVSASDPRQMLLKQQPPPKRKKCYDFTAKLNDQADLVVNSQGNSATAAKPMPAPKKSIQQSVSEDNFDFGSINDPFPLQSAVIIEDDQDDSKTSQETTLEVAMAKATTRAEVAALFSLIPPVALRSPCLLQPVYGKLSISDPYSLDERPCSSDIENARKILNNERKAGKNPRAIDFQGVGQFSENALSVLTRFCAIADMYRKVSVEANWLSQMKCSPGDLVRLQDALWHNPTTRPILKHGKKKLDGTSFSDLVEERYVDSFVIDICIDKFLYEARENGINSTVYFPTEFHDWMSSDDKAFQQQQLRESVKELRNINDLDQILLPVYMPNHWGLIFIDLANREMYFDDGMMSAVPPLALPSVKQSLELLLEMYPSHEALKTSFWRNCHSFQRFGMPSQVPVNSKMIGVGSCGVGVVMAARDIIRDGPLSIYNFQWQYCDMDLHRRDLMLQILNWGSA